MTEQIVDLKGLAAEIVSAHVANNSVASGELPVLIKSVYDALSSLGSEATSEVPEKPKPAVSIRASVKPDYIVCLEDGKKLKTMKRYLASRHNLTPDQYRARWGLPKDYPMVAPNYSDLRKTLAQTIGLGRKEAVKVAAAIKPVRAGAKKVAAKVEAVVATAPTKRRRRKPKAA
ncbi:MucR family transcriptional regulator [Sphingomonas sp. AP4-R1]|uniref:MucR family transcriptional regulator n=1 Tax=Sphingomonas sp. AP4-R1 TaxID=2735134 RepID=UPI0020A40F90|nr:MucR family transcriptional regulator [Sphingomonas sp. AP4-R1]